MANTSRADLAFKILSFLVALAALLLTIRQHRVSDKRHIEAENSAAQSRERQDDLADAQLKLQQEQENLARQLVDKNDGMNVITVLDLMARMSTDLMGTATTETKAGSTLGGPYIVRSSDAIAGLVRQTPSVRFLNKEAEAQYDAGSGSLSFSETIPYSGHVLSFQPKSAAIDSVYAIASAVMKSADATLSSPDFLQKYIAPIILPKCSSDDPSEAATALVLVSRLVPKDRRNQKDGAGLLDIERALHSFHCPKVRLNLPQADFSNFPLHQAVFAGAQIDRLSFRDSDLTGSSFLDASLHTVDFSGAILGEGVAMDFLANVTPITRAHLNAYINLFYANPRKPVTNFSLARMVDCKFEVGNGKGTQAPGSIFHETELRECDFDTANLNRALFFGADLVSCTFKNTNLGWAKIYQSDLSETTIEGPMTSLEGVSIVGGKFKDVAIMGEAENSTSATDFYCGGVALSKVRFESLDLSGAKFRDCSADKVNFKSCNLARATFGIAVAENAEMSAEFSSCNLVGSDFSNMTPENFLKLKFVEGCTVDYVVVPYNSECKSSSLEFGGAFFKPTKTTLTNKAVVVAVQIEPPSGPAPATEKIIYKGKIEWNGKYTWSDARLTVEEVTALEEHLNDDTKKRLSPALQP